MATNWVDRRPTYPNRYKVTKSDGSIEYITLERADEPTVIGTPINAENMNALEKGATAGLAAMPKAGGEFTGTVSTKNYFHFKIDDEHYMMIGKSNDEFVISMYNAGKWVETLRVAKDGSIISGNLLPKSGGYLKGWLRYNSYDDLEKTDSSAIRQTYIKDNAGVNVQTFQIRMDRK